MRPPCHAAGLGQEPVCLPQLRGAFGNRRYYRLSTVLDHGTFKELSPDIAPNDVLHFPDYQEKLAAASVKTGLKEAAVTAIGRIGGVQAVVAVLDSRFLWAA